ANAHPYAFQPCNRLVSLGVDYGALSIQLGSLYVSLAINAFDRSIIRESEQQYGEGRKRERTGGSKCPPRALRRLRDETSGKSGEAFRNSSCQPRLTRRHQGNQTSDQRLLDFDLFKGMNGMTRGYRVNNTGKQG